MSDVQTRPVERSRHPARRAAADLVRRTERVATIRDTIIGIVALFGVMFIVSGVC